MTLRDLLIAGGGILGGFLLEQLRREIRWRRRQRAAAAMAAAERTETEADDRAAADNYADIGDGET